MGAENSSCAICGNRCAVQQIEVNASSHPSSPAKSVVATPVHASSPAKSVAVEEEELDDDEDQKRLAGMRGRKKREGIQCESVSDQAVKDYVKPVYAKDDATKARLVQILKGNDKLSVLFGHLSASALDDVVNAFQDVVAREGEDLIRQGDEGDCLYIVNEGEVDVFVKRPNTNGPDPPGKGSKVVSLRQGALFGELALMYEAPRAATVTVSCPSCSIWRLGREPFKMLLAQSSQMQYERYEGWLSEVDILKTLNHYELSSLSECMESECFDGGEDIICQGEPGDRFFILEDGTAAAYIQGPNGEKEVKVYEGQGQYFGEIALLRNEPRKATVRATGQGAVVISLSKEDFTNILGPIQDILSRHIDRYPQYAALLK